MVGSHPPPPNLPSLAPGGAEAESAVFMPCAWCARAESTREWHSVAVFFVNVSPHNFFFWLYTLKKYRIAWNIQTKKNENNIRKTVTATARWSYGGTWERKGKIKTWPLNDRRGQRVMNLWKTSQQKQNKKRATWNTQVSFFFFFFKKTNKNKTR